jgi:hypothetical protein
VLLIGSLFLSMISSTADGSRALYGIARDDMTIKQLYHLNRFHVPARAMTVDLVVNVLLVLFISSNLAILVPEQHRVRAGARVRAERLPAAAQGTGRTGRGRSRWVGLALDRRRSWPCSTWRWSSSASSTRP